MSAPERAPRSLQSAGLRSALRFVSPASVANEKIWLYSAKLVDIPPMKEGDVVRQGVQFEIAISDQDSPHVAITLGLSDERIALMDQLRAGPIGPVWLIKIERKKGNPFWAFSDATTPESAVADDGDLPF